MGEYEWRPSRYGTAYIHATAAGAVRALCGTKISGKPARPDATRCSRCSRYLARVGS